MRTEKPTYTLTPDWRDRFTGYLISAILIPAFGLGLIPLAWLLYQRSRTRYIVSNDDIQIHLPSQQVYVELKDISRIEVTRTRLHRRFGIGRLMLHTPQQTYELRGIKEPGEMKTLLDAAVASEQQRLDMARKAEGNFPEYDPGTINPYNELVGMWQQGLISDEDFEREQQRWTQKHSGPDS